MIDEDSSGMNLAEGVSEIEPGDEATEVSVPYQHGLDQVMQLIAELKTDFETKIKYDESKERTINLLHQELQDYRNDLNLQYLRPLALEFLELYDSMSKIAEQYQTNDGNSESGMIAQELEGFLQDIEDSLSRHGFEIYQADSEQVDRTVQHVQKTMPTSDSTLDRQVAVRLRKGLRYGERILRPEGVNAYRYSEPSLSPEEA